MTRTETLEGAFIFVMWGVVALGTMWVIKMVVMRG